GDQVRDPSPIGSDGSAFSDRQLVGERQDETLRDVARGKRALVVNVKVVLEGGPTTQEIVIAGTVSTVVEHLGDGVVRQHGEALRKPLLIAELQAMVAGVASGH